MRPCKIKIVSGTIVAFLALTAISAHGQSCTPISPVPLKAESAGQTATRLIESALLRLQEGDARAVLSIADSLLQADAPASVGQRQIAVGLMAAAQAASGNLVAARPWIARLDGERSSAAPEVRARLDQLQAWVELRAGNLDRAETLLKAALSASARTADVIRLQLTLARAPLASAVRAKAAASVLSVSATSQSSWSIERAAALEILAELAAPDNRAALRSQIEAEIAQTVLPAIRSTLEYSLTVLALNAGDKTRALRHSAHLERAWLDKAHDVDPRWMWMRARALEAASEYSQAALAYDLALGEATRQRQPLDLALMASGLSFQQRFGPMFDAYLAFMLGPNSSLTPELALKKAVDAAELSRLADITGLMRDPCLVADARRRAGVSDPGTAVLYPVLLEDRVELMLVTAKGIQRFTAPASRADVQARANRWLAQLQQIATRLYLPTARSLHEVLVDPMLAYLRSAGVKHLVVAPDGVLRTIPFAALHDGKHFLIEEFSVSVVPGLNLTQTQPMNRAAIKTLAVGLSEARQGFEALPAVEQELSFVARTLQCTPVLNGSFTTQRLRQDLAGSRASVVHVASHAEFSPDPRETFLLTYDGKLSLEDFRDSLLTSARQRAPLDLLVLSACQTAVGDERAALGLAGIALRTGARTAVASLWQVSDDSTNKLVQRFYEALIAEGRARGEAMRLAQLEVLKTPDFAHPAFWAPFILVGNWM